MPFVIGHHHRCYPEALQFVTFYVSRIALCCPAAIEDDCLIIGTGRLVLQVHDVRAVLNFLRTGHPDVSTIRFDHVVDVSHRADESIVTLPGDRIGPTLCTYLLGYAWERHGREVAARQPTIDKNGRTIPNLPAWDVDLQFFRHLRNACFHRGEFQIRPGQIAAPNLPKWRWRQIPGDLAKINGRKVINDFLPVSDVLTVLHDMGNAIDRVLGRST